MFDKFDILERLQFLADSGWNIQKGALPANEVIAARNCINGDIHILPVFDGFCDDVDMYYCWKNRKNPSPIGDLNHLVQSPYEIRINLRPSDPIDGKNRIRGTYTGEYAICRKTDRTDDLMQAIQERGLHLKYDLDKRLFLIK